MTQFCRFINTPSYSTQHTALYFAYDLEPIDEREQYANEARAQVRFLTPQSAMSWCSTARFSMPSPSSPSSACTWRRTI